MSIAKSAGIGTPSYMGLLSAILPESQSGLYLAANLNDRVRLTNPWRALTTGATWVWLQFSQPVPVQLVSLIGHNLTTTGTVRLRLYPGVTSSFSSTPIFDSGTIQAWPSPAAPAGYRAVRPMLLPQAVYAQSIAVNLDTATALAVSLDAIDVSGWWDLGGLSVGKTTGFDARTPVQRLAGGADDIPSPWIPRTVSASLALTDVTLTQGVGLDFLRGADMDTPFVFSPDIHNPSSWARTCMLARNQKMNPYTGALYRRDVAAFSLIEHQR